MKNSSKKSPLKAPPLRLPGQSLDDQRYDIAYDEVVAPSMAIMLAVLLAVLEWFRYFMDLPLMPWFCTVIAVIVAVYFGCKIVRAIPRLRLLRQGSEGEKVIGQLLEKFRADGFQVYHDILGEGFNIDHVIVGPQGTFTIETKTISKPQRGSVEVVFDGEKITVNGWTPERDPVVQAQAESKWLHDMLQSASGRSFWVQPVIVYPGWYVREIAQESRIWVLNPDRLLQKIKAQPVRLAPEDIALIGDRISVHVRNCVKS